MTNGREEASEPRDIEFKVRGVTVRGRLQVPAGEGPHPVVILAHGMGGAKEWSIPAIAEAFVADGIAALAFDYRSFGDSDGEPRDEVDHCGQVEDFQEAITFASTVEELDPDRIGLWSTSLGGRNALVVAALDWRVKCLVVQVPGVGTDLDLWAMMMSDGDPEALRQRLNEDRRDRALGKEPQYVVYPEDDSADYAEYWGTFGAEEKRNWPPRITLQSLWPTPVDDMIALMPKIAPKPLLMLIADEEYPRLLEAQRAAFEAAGEPKKLIVGHGHHYSVYTTWNEEAVGAAREWFGEHLVAKGSGATDPVTGRLDLEPEDA
ncbi:MAG: alpha/beta fold hydrolase [Actinobacteria bacterium]|nr:alpha/beta fold hydrolase [Actinomycetota bacterium]